MRRACLVGWVCVLLLLLLPAAPAHPCCPQLLLQSEDKTLRLINSMWHIIVREPGGPAGGTVMAWHAC